MSRSLAGASGDQEHAFRGAAPVAGRTSTCSADRPGNHTRAIERNVDRSALEARSSCPDRASAGSPRARCRARPVRRARTSPRRRRRPTEHARVPVPVYASAARYPLRNWSYECSEASTSSGPAASGRPSPLGCASEASAVGDDGDLVLLCVPDSAIAEVASGDRARPVARARLGRDAALGAGAASTPFLAPSAADVHARTRARAARRRLGGGHVGIGRGAVGRLLARRDARPAALRARRRRAPALPRRRRDRVELPRHAARGRIRTVSRRGCAARGARSVDAAHDRQRLRADRPDRAR